MRSITYRVAILITILCALGARVAAGQTPPLYLQLSPTVKAVLYSPDPSVKSRVAVVNMHEDGNRLADIACTELVKRGFYVLCMNGRSDNNEALDFWSDLPLDVATGIKYLKETVKASKILLYGGSGGAPLMTFYQNVAQNGPSVCQGTNKLIPCGNDLAGLRRPTASSCATPTRAPRSILCARSILRCSATTNRSRCCSRSIRSIEKWLQPDRARSNYAREFKERYFRAQAARMNRLVDAALGKLRAIEAGKYYYNDDDAFVIHQERGRPSLGNGFDDPSRHSKAAQAIEERRHDRDRDH